MILGKLILVVLIGYLIGSIPFGSLIARRKANIDIRQHGSGRTGATNILRTLGKKTAAIVMVLDGVKGILAVLFAGILVGEEFLAIGSYHLDLLFAQALAAIAAICGHIWPIFHNFRGGRGVATFFGGLLALSPVAAIFGGEIFIIGAGLSGFVSLGSLAGAVGTYAILVPLTVVHGFPVEYLGYTVIGSLILIIMHRDNIVRLLKGHERRLGQKTDFGQSVS
jgi:glycerol-3-phosphate acyltransferase PlsY